MAFLRDPRERSAAPPPNTTAGAATVLIALALLASIVVSGAEILRWSVELLPSVPPAVSGGRAPYGGVR